MNIDPSFKQIKKATQEDGQLKVLFANGDNIAIPLTQLLQEIAPHLDEKITVSAAQSEVRLSFPDIIPIDWEAIRYMKDKEAVLKIKVKEAEAQADSVGLKIATARKQKGYSPKYLGDIVGLSSQSINKIESGKTSINTIRLYQLATALGLTVPELLAVVVAAGEDPVEDEESSQ